jgi:hypothetical protein
MMMMMMMQYYNNNDDVNALNGIRMTLVDIASIHK